MAKQEKLDFDYEEYFNEQFETTAVLMWNTHHAPFTFASYFNKLYNKQLERILYIEKTLEVLKFDKSKDFNNKQLENI